MPVSPPPSHHPLEKEPRSKSPRFRFSIDRGGTFTDVFAECPSGKTRVCKLLSRNDECYGDAPTEGIRRIIELDTGIPLSPSSPIDSNAIEWIRMGTTVATNALLERKGERTALLITKGFKELLHIGNQARPQIFDLTVTCPSQIYSDVVEVDERVYLMNDGLSCRLFGDEGQRGEHSSLGGRRKVQLKNGSVVIVEKELDVGTVEGAMRELLLKGVKALAVVFIHSWAFDEHELLVKKLGEGIGFKHVSVSSEVMKMVRVVPRGFTTVVDSYTTPLIRDYLESFKKGFTNLSPSQVLFMQSDGGLTSMNRFCGSRAILSGPAGGVVGYARTVFDAYREPVIGFDMGGTSTDVSRFDGEFLHSFENCTAGVMLQTAQLDIQTVAAGGGSILTFRSGIYCVGPGSAGANPGPVCYDQGGQNLTITDANVVLNRIVPSRFPKIFGPNHDSELNVSKAVERFEALRVEINEFNKGIGCPELSLGEVALGFVRVANETMARPIRNITQGKGFDPKNHMLACFGGAGGQHACAVAESLGVQVVCVPRYAGILSAVGIFLADVVVEGGEPVGKVVASEDSGAATVADGKSPAVSSSDLEAYVRERLDKLCVELEEKLLWDNNSGNIRFEKFLNMRYSGTDCAIMVRGGGDERVVPKSTGCPSLLKQFCEKFVLEYSRQFGFTLEGRNVVVDDLRVRAVVVGSKREPQHGTPLNVQASAITTVSGYFQNVGVTKDCPVYEISGTDGFACSGPCLILDELSTIVVEAGWKGVVSSGSVRLEGGRGGDRSGGDDTAQVKLDNVVLSVFSHRFMSIAEQMGRILQRTSVSTNIKERLDFSCAIFGVDGGLVSNAPHIPVHLGAMQEAVQYQLRVAANCTCSKCKSGCDSTSNLDNAMPCSKLCPGDVILTNHPVAGGSHLPDLTVITPVFDNQHPAPIFFVANRGHHADIGGSTPGSMPPHSKTIHEEGAVFKSFKLVKRGVFMEKELVRELERPGETEGCSGSRCIGDNLSDLRAQVAANRKGIDLIQSLISEYSLPYIQTYMTYIQENAELAVRDMLREVAMRNRNVVDSSNKGDQIVKLSASDLMDDGTEIRLSVEIDGEVGTGVFDFTGSGWEVGGNCNAPRAITLSAVIYCLRCLVGREIPLNQGCLRPIKIIIPNGSILSPSEDAAVVGGNVLTSQRVVDVILKAFKACAASQGCMNNVTFGNKEMGYYETVAGGSGAGPTWHGRSGVHSHMTNTRITDPEILELRYPVILNHFSLERGTGGKGRYTGGDGVRREILFRRTMRLSVLTERRVFTPYGMEGGEDGGRGANLLVKGWFYDEHKRDIDSRDRLVSRECREVSFGRVVNLGGKTSVDVEPGDLFVLISPGGGGWGAETCVI